MFTSKTARYALAAVGLAATAAMTVPSTAEAQPRHPRPPYGGSYHHHHRGGGGGAFVGGLILGGALGAMAAPRYYGPGYYYGPRAYYDTPRYGCRWVWRYNEWGERYRARVCYRG